MKIIWTEEDIRQMMEGGGGMVVKSITFDAENKQIVIETEIGFNLLQSPK